MRQRPHALLSSLAFAVFVASIASASPPVKRAAPEKGSGELRRQGDRVLGGSEAAEVSKGDGAETVATAWRNYYLVQLAGDPLASYRGGVPGFAATSPQILGTRKLEPQRPEVAAYRGYLASRQDEALAAISQTLARAVTVLRRYDAAFHGFAIEMTPEEADRVRRVSGVRAVFRNEIRELVTDAGPTWIGAPGIWNGTATGGLPGTRGEGVIVGVIDSGINSDHPSFADVGGDAFDHTNPLGSGVYRGWCNPGFPILTTCNDKLIGMWSYPESGNNPEDDDGHGSHTASTSAGNVVTATVNAPTTSLVTQISGVAPHANIIAYDACAGGCPSTALVASVNQAILDGVDVINYSITGGSEPYADAVSIAFLNATAAGILVSAAAENDGPGAGSVGHSEPWVQTVAAATHNRKIINRLINKTGGDTPPPADITGKGFTSGYGPAPIVYAGNFGNPLCPLGAFPPGTFSGQIVVCDRGGGIGRVDKAQSVLNGGAGGFVLANDAVSGNALVGDAYPLPGVHITFTDGVTLKTWLASGSGHMGSIAGWSLDLTPANGDIMAGFSARGPSSSLPDLLKPDVTAPGVDVLAAVSNGPTPPEFDFLSGTSMATPHMTGAAALIRALRPTWSPLMVKSALMLTTVTAVRKEDETTPATPFDMGAGRVDLTKAGIAGFVLDESYSNFSAANPAAGGNPTTLNLASLADGSCFQTCSWERTVLSTVSASRTWTGTVSAPAGVVVSITSPNPFALPGGTARILNVSVDVSAAAKNQWHFASILWSDGPGNSPDLRMPIVVFAQGSTDLLTLVKTVDAPVTSPGARLDYTIRVANRSPSTATYSVYDPIPTNTTYIPGSATGGLTFHPGDNTLTGTTGPLAGLQPTVSANPSPFGFVPPASLLGTFNMCALTTQCDDTIINLSGVDFFYLGVRYNVMRIASNGYVQPGAPPIGALLPNQNLPNPADPDLVISPFWADLDMNGTSGTDPGGGFFYFGGFEDPSNGDPYLVIGWEDAQLFGDPAQNYSFQIWIKEGTDQIWFVYQEINGGLPTGPFGGLTVGVENGDGTAGMSRFYRPEGSCAPTCGSDVGTPPAIGTDLKVNSVEASATFTFAVTVSPATPPGTLIQNVVTATDGTRTFQAVADSLVSLPPVGILVTPTSGLTTTEAGGTAQFNISLLSAPTGTVTIALSSDDTTEGTVSPPSVTFDGTDWNTPQPVTVTGVDDLIDDGDVVYHIVTAPAVSTDNRYSKLDPADVTVTNIDDESNEGRFFTVTPCRMLDTRLTGGPLPSSFPIELLMRGRCGISGAAKAVTINVTVVDATAVGSLTVYPFSATVPGTNSVSFRAIQARAANSIIGLDTAGRIGAQANIPGGGTVHLIIDVSGYFE